MIGNIGRYERYSWFGDLVFPKTSLYPKSNYIFFLDVSLFILKRRGKFSLNIATIAMNTIDYNYNGAVSILLVYSRMYPCHRE